MKKSRRILLSLLVLGLLTTLMSVGTYALWTASSATAGSPFATGTLSLGNDHTASAVATMSSMVPGDSVSGLVTVQNTGSEDITSYALATSVTAASPTNPNVLSTDSLNGLQLYVQRCSVAWTGSGAPATCSGTRTDVVGTSAAPVAIIGSGMSLASNAFCSSAAAGQRTARGLTCTVTDNDYLKVRISLPTTAGNTFQGLSSTIAFTFSGSQPAAAAF